MLIKPFIVIHTQLTRLLITSLALKGTGSRLSACSLIKLLLFNLLLILSVNNPTHAYPSDLRAYFKEEFYDHDHDHDHVACIDDTACPSRKTAF